MAASWYWKFVRLNSAGRCITEEIPEAKQFFAQQFEEQFEEQFSNGLNSQETIESSQLSPDRLDRSIQRQLFNFVQNPQNTESHQLAKLCFRCYISHQIRYVCTDLEARFGTKYGFTQFDLLPYVLNDVDPAVNLTFDSATHSTFALHILATFNPENGSLATWTNRQVRHHKELNAVLLTEYGLYLCSDWAILNKTKPDRLQKVRAEMLLSNEDNQESVLLEIYHEVYRAERRQNRTRGVCRPPTHLQLSQIAEQFYSRTDQLISSETVLKKLLTIADGLRQYEIAMRGGWRTESIDEPNLMNVVEQRQITPSYEDIQEENQFLQRYQHKLVECLDQAIDRTIVTRLTQLQQRKVTQHKANIFVSALELYYCSNKTMTEIAEIVGLKGQYEITRLRIKDDFPQDVFSQTLNLLKADVLELAEYYTEPDRLQKIKDELEKMLSLDLEEKVLAKAKSKNSLFAQRLCFVCQRFRQSK
jgi:hypothetical protein